MSSSRNKPKISKLKKEADRVFSIYIRKKYEDKQGKVRCYTCGHEGTVKTMQNGHCLPRQYLITRYDETNCRPQCYACNMLYGGQVVVFVNKLCEEYGETFRLELEKKKWEITKWDATDYQKIIDKYKE